MALQTCPTDIVAATAERVWELLTIPEGLARWSGTKLLDGPRRPLAAGDRVVLGPGFGLEVILEVRFLERPTQFAVDAHLPFGVINHEVIRTSSLEGRRCRVTFN